MVVCTRFFSCDDCACRRSVLVFTTLSYVCISAPQRCFVVDHRHLVWIGLHTCLCRTSLSVVVFWRYISQHSICTRYRFAQTSAFIDIAKQGHMALLHFFGNENSTGSWFDTAFGSLAMDLEPSKSQNSSHLLSCGCIDAFGRFSLSFPFWCTASCIR